MHAKFHHCVAEMNFQWCFIEYILDVKVGADGLVQLRPKRLVKCFPEQKGVTFAGEHFGIFAAKFYFSGTLVNTKQKTVRLNAARDVYRLLITVG